MASPGNPTRESAPQSSWSITGMIADWIRQGTEGFIATQKILLDLAAQQNALALTIAKDRLGLTSFAPSKALADLTAKTVHNFMQAQYMVLDLAARQNEILTQGLKPGMEHTPIEGLAEVVHQSVAACIAAQKEFLQIVEAETEGAVRDFEQRKGFESERLAKVAREGARNFISTQRKFLEIVEEELLTEGGKPAKKKGEQKKVDLFEMAKDSVDAFVETQKHLLDLASDQVDINVKLVREMVNMDIQKRPAMAIPEVLKKSADSFVAAQKALVELASRPRKTVIETEKARKHHPEIVIAKA